MEAVKPIEGGNGSNVESAKEALKADKTARLESCWGAIKAILKDHRCAMVPRLIIQGGKSQHDVTLVAED